MTQETEVKIALDPPQVGISEARSRIEHEGFTIHKERVFERNLVFDRAAGELQRSRQLLRLRAAGPRATLTYKGVPDDGGKHKSREERETTVDDFDEMRVILERLGFRVVFVYEKYRTEYTRNGQSGAVTLDETPIGEFLELEGEAAWIDQTAKLLGFRESHYLTASYGAIYREWCEKHGITPGNMCFGECR